MSPADAASLFGWQLVTGLILSLFVPLVGVGLRLRREWLAALGFAHAAAAGGVLAVVVGQAAMAGALVAAFAAALLKGLLRRAENTGYAVMIVGGWAVMLLGAVNHHRAQIIGQALVDGQLYFTGWSHLIAAAALAGTGGMLLSRLMPTVLHEELFPGSAAGGGAPVRLHLRAFDLLVAASVAMTAIAMGIMAAFALVLIPAWIAFGIAPDWRSAARIAAAVGVAAYLVAFVAAILLDQPFGPVLVAALLATAPLRLLARRLRSAPR